MSMELTYKNCRLCPIECGVDRTVSVGSCGASDKCEVAKIMLHHFEEPFLSGESTDARGSGTVFFAHCSLKCAYCQNHKLSRCSENFYKSYTADELKVMFLQLEKDGAYNINLVTPTHYLITIKEAVIKAKAQGLKIPIVYNTSGYEKSEVIESLSGVVDIFLTDFKYYDNSLSAKYSGVADYNEVALSAHRKMVELTGKPKFDKNGFMLKGVIVRHLILPPHAEDSKNVLKLLYDNFKHKIYISIMNQFTVTDGLDKEKFPQLNKNVSRKTYETLIEYALNLGITNALIQEDGTAEESFIPDFSN